ncbi:MAG: isoprenylcysteine carboxylmethyltransferase family protein [Bacteroidales bacterium]|jgi:protein-S-isoprenylcysteine O-methyltransferase Ste14|nr:isoprenylcysteine carboxylmethyltransferase family protein [Bacteroidales bacterium]MDD2323060.1 isoprenylcysteine carboxylmethyltransferase family protein [Bacteroidales bacterium]MDD3011063.1 isoprenylcysteine carboxylmethyltransferase family protein [Bacteroidales bacterium]MDD3960422.1 isoprenylcysteine carboxylmethyltransferase family protein [Bacteroidales bacterium]MDY0285544.1 isoprenylcysteine carboxylmethyltransferase family protein [Bacteroidales bacterium]
MEQLIFKTVFLIGVVLQFVIRLRYNKVSRKSQLPVRASNPVEFIFSVWAFSGFYIIPFLYIFTPLFRCCNYGLPLGLSLPMSLFYPFGVWLFYKSHHDLGKYWWMGHEHSYNDELVTQGIFAWVRHPMYTGFFLIGIGNIFLLQNYFAGFSTLVGLIPLLFLHQPCEDRHLAKHFGEAFKHYRSFTGKFFPGRRKAGH